MQKKTQPQNNQGHPPSAETTYPPVPQSGTWKTDYAWVSGMAGALSVLIIAAVYNRYNLLNTGFSLGGERISGHIDTKLFALVCVALVMLLVELIRLWLWDKRDFFRLHPLIKNKQYVDFAVECVVNFLLHLLLLFAVLVFYRSAGEYGYLKNAAFYQAWFRFIDIIWSAYLWGGLPYVLLTRAVKYDTQADQRDYSSLVKKVLVLLALKPLQIRTSPLGERDKKAIRGLLVKLFFAPLMTVFFVDQFGHLVNNMGYLVHLASSLGSGAAYTIRKFNNDVYNLSHAFIFSIDVALAWCGYVVSSRWVDNQTVSAEPTLLGWVVCIFCYPPFNNYLGLYYSAPSERMILQGQEQGLVAFFTVMMALSYLVYMSATLWFGVRFSNLTNRGIIRKGPFAIIRHPAYASKNFAWWCVMFPAIVLNLIYVGNWKLALMQVAGLVLMTWFYYMRAITEEKHLSEDPAYIAYCKQVKYRFIPGVV